MRDDNPARLRVFVQRRAQRGLRGILRALLALLCIVGFATGAAADSTERLRRLSQMSIETLMQVEVVTPSRLPETLFDSPNVVSVYTAREIELFGARDLGEVLAKLPSFLPFDTHSGGRARQSIRGDDPTINNTHVLLLLDGTPLNRESYAGGIWTQAMMSSIPLRIIERIEVVRGPGSVLYGTNAFSGVVNIITKRPDGPHADALVGYQACRSHAGYEWPGRRGQRSGDVSQDRRLGLPLQPD